MDRPEGTGEQASQDVAQEEAGASVAQERDSESSVMNRLIRGAGRVVGSIFGNEDDSARDDAEQEAKPEATAQPKPQVDLNDPAVQAEIDRRAQSLKDREVTRLRRESAAKAADDGDPARLVELAESGNEGDVAYAERELARRGFTYEAGQVTAKRVQAEQSTEEQQAVGSQIAATLVPHFDQAVLEPVLKAAPKEFQDRVIAEGIEGLDGRTKAVTEAIEAIKADAEKQTAVKLLSDEKFVARMLKTEGFRKGLITDPVANKQLRAYFRGELDEPDLNPGVGRGGGLERENDVMNAEIRAAAGLAVDRTATGRRAERDAPDDDE